MTTNLCWQTILYVTGAPNFWLAMGMTTATAMLIGALIWDGNLRQVTKAIVTLGSYVIMLIWLLIDRIANVIPARSLEVNEFTYAGIFSIIITSFFWILGIELGVLIFNRRYKGHPHNEEDKK